MLRHTVLDPRGLELVEQAQRLPDVDLDVEAE